MQKAHDLTTGCNPSGSILQHSSVRQRAEFEAICQAMGDGVIVFDMSGMSVLVNDAQAKLCGYAHADEMKRDLAYFKSAFEVYELDGTIIPLEEWPVSLALRGETFANLELKAKRKDTGAEWVISFSGGPVFNGEGVQTLAIVVSRDITARKQAEELLDAQKHSLEMVLSNAPLEEVLSFLTGVVEKQSKGEAVASILLLDNEGRLRHGAAPSLPHAYNQAIDGIKARDDLGTCSIAAVTGKVVVTSDIETAPPWASIKHLPLEQGLKAAWSHPIISRDGQVIGTFGTYFRQKREPSLQEKRIVEMLARMAAIAIEHAQGESAIRQNEAQNQLLIALDDTIRPLTDPNEITQTAARMLGEHLHVNRCAYAEVEADEDTFNLTGDYNSGVQTIVGRYTFTQFGQECLALMRANKPYVVQDSEHDPRCAEVLHSYRLTAIRSVICVPLHKAGRFVGAMAVHSTQPRQWQDHEIELVETVAARCWESIERARVARTLRESEKQFRDLADSINQMIWVTRPDGYHEYYNKRWYEYTGVPFGSTDGEAWNGVFHQDDQEKAWARWRHSLATGEPYEIEYRLRRADGMYRWVLGRAECVKNEKGGIIKWYGTCTDIQDLVDARQKAQEANVAKSDFLANMSHEIRTPMNAVVGLAHLLAMDKTLSVRQREMVSTLKLSAQSLLHLINDLLDIAKIETNQIDLESIPFTLSDIIKEVNEVLLIKAQEKGITLDYVPSPLDYRIFLGDPLRIRQVVMNLVSNAIKFTERGSVTISLTASPCAQPRSTYVHVSVSDTGIGIAPDKLEGIFDKFTQGDNSTTRKYGGTGLGLAISKNLAEILGGSITVKSEPGAGSEFTLHLPLEFADEHVLHPQAENLPLSESALERARGHVLLVEDYKPNIMVASQILKSIGYTCDSASSGKEALARIRSHRQCYNAVLMDIQMPDMDGFSVTGIIRSEEQAQGLPHLPIIAMTAHALQGDRERCLKAGMDQYLSKPFQPSQLKDILEPYCTKEASSKVMVES